MTFSLRWTWVMARSFASFADSAADSVALELLLLPCAEDCGEAGRTEITGTISRACPMVTDSIKAAASGFDSIEALEPRLADTRPCASRFNFCPFGICVALEVAWPTNRFCPSDLAGVTGCFKLALNPVFNEPLSELLDFGFALGVEEVLAFDPILLLVATTERRTEPRFLLAALPGLSGKHSNFPSKATWGTSNLPRSCLQ
mmetsp:Transcript_42063/g.85730  ORF Transcript_42063/g.85730 Transcript_42063/m.85730 type:complete len:202 (-) Transcript_42063:2794-3399(-)